MTIRAVVGLLLLNVHFVVVGAVLLWGARGWRSWGELIRLSGLAYFLGLASSTVVLSAELVLGVSFGVPALLATSTALVVGGLTLGVVRRRPGIARPKPRRPSLSVPTVIFGGMLLVVLVWLFRAARLEPLGDVDSWRVWTIRGKALTYFGDLGGDALVGGDRTDYASYPPGLSLLHGQAFEAMGSVDTVTLHLQHWFLAVGFLAAIIGLFIRRVQPAILFPFILLLAVMPGFVERVTWTRADCLMGYFAGIGALLLYTWTEDRARWRIEVAAPLLAGALLTKREAAVLVVCVLLATLVAAGASRRAWRPVVSIAALAVVLAIPWRAYIASAGVSDGPAQGSAFLGQSERALPALWLVVRTFFEPMWLGLGMFVVLGAALALAVGDRRMPKFALTVVGLALVGWACVIWAETGFAITQDPTQNPVFRMTLALMLVAGPFAPLLFATAWAGSTDRNSGHRSHVANVRSPDVRPQQRRAPHPLWTP